MAYKNYKIRDNWLDIDKYNDVDIQSIDGVIQTVKVNGEDVGGGGSSDFSTAEVTINAIIEGSPTLVEKGFVAEILYPEVTTNPYAGGFDDFNGNIILYKNDAFISIDSLFASDSNETIYVASDNPTAPTISGNATYDNETGRFIITGDCTITVTMVQGN